MGRFEEEKWGVRRALRRAVFWGMRVILQTSVELSAVISRELIVSVTVAYPQLHGAHVTVVELFTLYCPLMQLNIPREPGDIVQ